jgi:hypothetical protein
MITVMALSSVFILPIIQFGPQIPSMLLFEYTRIPHVGWWAQTAIVSAPAALIYTILIFVELVVLRWLVLGCLSLVMKGETVPAGEAWEGAPIAPRRSINRDISESPSSTTLYT